MERCNSFGCVGPKGHNRGQADVPENHLLPVLRRPYEEVYGELQLLREGLIRCAELAGADGEAVEAARSGAMVQPHVITFATDAVRQLRKDYEEVSELD